MKKIFLLSGVLDSTINLGLELENGKANEMECLTFDYGQRHQREIESARCVAESYGLKHKVMEAKFFEGCALVGDEELENGYSKTAIVPNRNMVFLSIAGAYALQTGARCVIWSAIKDDAEIFKDCRPEFLKNINCTLAPLGVEVHAPIIEWTKKKLVKEAIEKGIAFSNSWSCYRGEKEPCGECGACLLREEAISGSYSI